MVKAKPNETIDSLIRRFKKDVEKAGFNPVTHQTTKCIRRELYLETELPIGNEYSNFISNILKTNGHASK